MLSGLDSLREMTLLSVVVRLCMAQILGGLLGLERVRKRRPAGFRTYMLTCIGAALAMILGQYQAQMMNTQWLEAALDTGSRTDITRFSAQIISGIGFLGAGTVIVTSRQEIKGLTTAAGLWASACMGIAIGAGFYECVLLAFGLIFLCNRVFPYIETAIVENARNMNLYIEFDSLDNIGRILGCIKAMDTQIYDVDIERPRQDRQLYPNAAISLRLNQRKTHAKLIFELSELECVRMIEVL